MSFSFLPSVITEKITDLSAQWLLQNHVQLLMLDFDNTIIPYTTNVPDASVVQWMQDMQRSGITLCIVSNSKKQRVPEFCRKYGIDCVTHANKPGTKGFRRCMDRFRVSPDRAMMVGDQIFTDVLGANACGVRSVLVRSIDNHNFWLKARHVLEKPFIFAARKRRIQS